MAVMTIVEASLEPGSGGGFATLVPFITRILVLIVEGGQLYRAIIDANRRLFTIFQG